jgi:hypothetical protein
MTNDITDRCAYPSPRQLEDVVPVAADLVAGRQISRRRRHADDLREAPWQQAPLKKRRDAMLVLQR